MESRAKVSLAYVVFQTTSWDVGPTGQKSEVRAEVFASNGELCRLYFDGLAVESHGQKVPG
jgi:hypothetical protein